MQKIDVYPINEIEKGQFFELGNEKVFIRHGIMYGKKGIYRLPKEQGVYKIGEVGFINKAGQLYVQAGLDY